MNNIGEQAFSGAPINEFIVADNNAKYFSRDGVLFYRKNYRLLKYPPAKKSSKYIVTNETRALCSFAFKGASYLEEIVLHEGVSTFEGEQTFCDCTSLKEIRIPSTLECLPNSCFAGCKSLEQVYVLSRNGLIIEKESFKGCPSLTGLHLRIEVLENIDISDDAFDEDTFNLCSLYVPSGTRWAYRHHPLFGKFKNIEIERVEA